MEIGVSVEQINFGVLVTLLFLRCMALLAAFAQDSVPYVKFTVNIVVHSFEAKLLLSACTHLAASWGIFHLTVIFQYSGALSQNGLQSLC